MPGTRGREQAGPRARSELVLGSYVGQGPGRQRVA